MGFMIFPASMNCSPDVTQPPLRVILAEGSALVRVALRQMLAEVEGVVVVGEAASGDELLSLLRSTHAHLVLLDLGLSCRDLAVALAAYKTARPGVRVIALSQLCSPALDQHCFTAGVDSVLSKTGGLERLAQTLVRFSRQQFPGDSGQPCIP